MTHPLPDKAVEAGLARFNEVINDPIMEPCAKCSGKGYHHGFGPGGVEPDWCTDCGGNQFNIRPGEELRAMQAAIETALAAEGLVVVRADRLDAHRQRGKNALADHLCATLMTDGFCSPRNDEGRMSAPQQCVHMTKGEHRDCCARAEGLVKAIESRGCKIVWVHDRAMIKAAQEGHPTPPVLRGQRNE